MSLGTRCMTAPGIGCIKLNVRNQVGPCRSMSGLKTCLKRRIFVKRCLGNVMLELRYLSSRPPRYNNNTSFYPSVKVIPTAVFNTNDSAHPVSVKESFYPSVYHTACMGQLHQALIFTSLWLVWWISSRAHAKTSTSHALTLPDSWRSVRRLFHNIL